MDKAVQSKAAKKLGSQGGYRPPHALTPPPIFLWPPRPLLFLRWFFGLPGYLLPWHIIYTGIPVATWFFLMPDLAETKTFEVGWISYLFIRNFIMLVIFTSAWHIPLYVQRLQGTHFKHDYRWPVGDNPNFLFRNQTLDNMFWTLAVAVPVWTAFEAVSYWGQSNGYFPVIGFADHPIYCIVLMLVIPLWRDVHFYCIHRLIHWGKLYDWVHELHHRNVNPGPWSGLAMHPVESIFYFSSVVLLWVVPAHPFHVLFLLQNMAFSASHGHAGFDRLGDDEHGLNTEVYMHYLHHKYFEVNYGSLGLVPIDQWFGTDHDGTPEADARMNARMMKLAEKRAAKIKS